MRRALAAWTAAVASAALLGCLDALVPGAPPQHSASLLIAPAFDGWGAAAGIPSDVDLIRISLALGSTEQQTTRDYPVAPGQDSIEVRVTVPTSARGDSVYLYLQALRTSDNTVLYTASQTVYIAAGASTAPVPIQAQYVGPGANIQSIAISPQRASLQPGGTTTFGFQALDSSGATISGMPVLFASRRPDVAIVDAAGTAHAVSPGQAYIVVTSGARTSVKDSALLTVGTTPPPAVTFLTVSPGYLVMLPGDTVGLQATTVDSAGNTTRATGVLYTSLAPTVATVHPTTGVVAAQSTGSTVILAQDTLGGVGLTGLSLVIVPPSGSPVALAVGDGRVFDEARVGDTVTARVVVDMRAVPDVLLGSYSAELDWNPQALTYVGDAAVAGGFAPPTVNTAGVQAGQLLFAATEPNGTLGEIALIDVKFVVAASGTSPLALTLTGLSEPGTTPTSLLPATVIVSGSVAIP